MAKVERTEEEFFRDVRRKEEKQRRFTEMIAKEVVKLQLTGREAINSMNIIGNIIRSGSSDNSQLIAIYDIVCSYERKIKE